MRIRMKYVRSWIDRKTGRTYAFFRRRGYPSARLPGSIGSAEFLAAYHSCLRGEHPAPAIAEMKARSGPGTINAAVALYLDSNAFMHFGKSTRALRRSILKKFCELVGDKPLALLNRKYIDRLLQSMPSPVVARTWLLALRPPHSRLSAQCPQRLSRSHSSPLRMDVVDPRLRAQRDHQSH
jgi:hypothetical protein